MKKKKKKVFFCSAPKIDTHYQVDFWFFPNLFCFIYHPKIDDDNLAEKVEDKNILAKKKSKQKTNLLRFHH